MKIFRRRGGEKQSTSMIIIMSSSLIQDRRYIITGTLYVEGVRYAKLTVFVTDPTGKVTKMEITASKDGTFGNQIIAGLGGDYLFSARYDDDRDAPNAHVVLTLAVVPALTLTIDDGK